jgi:hypothetical protein
MLSLEELGQHFGAAEDHAERVFQVVGDGAENFILEAVGALQSQPLRRQPAIGLHQRAGALRDAVLELGVGLIELLIENDIVERDRQPAAEDFHQRPVGVGQIPLRLQQHHDFAPAAGSDVENAAVIGELMLAALKGCFHHLPQIGFERFRSGRAGEAAVAARPGQHGKIVARGAAVAQHQDAGAIDIQQ